ncbi:hypothetical protein M422DRAFT_25764 [Sphaerobolus stellatus SS14]|nr:hypothetical protein M422DRAFT_25764 [Sphaerobolus stellatus SS14]
MGSLQNHFYPGASPGQSLGPIAIPDMKRALSGSYDRDPAAFFNSFRQAQFATSFGNQAIQAEEDLCKNYTCCNQHIPDLHALVDHFESNHVLIDDMPLSVVSGTIHAQNNQYIPAPSNPHLGAADDTSPPAFDADDMDMDTSELSPSPPQTPSSSSSYPTNPNTNSSALPSAFDPIHIVSPFYRPKHHSSYSSLAGANGPMAPANPALNLASTAVHNAFNRYAGYSDYSSCLPGTDPSPSYHVSGGAQKDVNASGGCMPTALIFSSAEPTPLNTPVPSRTGSPESSNDGSQSGSSIQGMQTGYQGHSVPSGTLPLHPSSTTSSFASQSASRASQSQQSTSTPSSNPTPSPSSSTNPHIYTKPFRCPKPGCNKSYKQANGLKYHLSHGSCNFAPRDPEVEKLSEAERDKRLRPYVCKVGTECGRRYKNMNGLRYHYQHTGEHGRIGLEMLSMGRHPLPEAPNGTGAHHGAHSRAHSPKGGMPSLSVSTSGVSLSVSSSAASTPLATPTTATATPTPADFASMQRGPTAGYFPVNAHTGLAPPVVSSVGVQQFWSAMQAQQMQQQQKEV